MSTIRQRLGRIRYDLTLKGEVALERPEILKGAGYLARFFLAFVLSRAEIFGGYTPFGVAVVAVSGPGIGGFLAFAGIVLGQLVGGDFFFGLEYVAMSVLVYAASFVFCDLRLYQRYWFKPLVAVCMAAATGFVYVQDAGFTMTAVVFYITETVLIGGGAYFFQIALSGWGEAPPEEGGDLKRSVSALILIGTCLIALVGVTFFGNLSVGRLLAVLLVMCTAYKSGVGSGSATGAALGLAMDAGIGGTPLFAMTYAFSGLLSGLFGRHGKLMFTLSFVLTNAVAVLWTWGSALHVAAIYEVFLGSMLFIFLPGSVIGKCAIDLGEPVSDTGDGRTRAHAQGRIQGLAEAFRALYETTKTPAVWRRNDNDIATVFDRAAESCCRKCPSALNCWRIDYENTLDVMNNVTGPMQKRGELQEEDFPQHFRESCKHLPRYIDLVNFELRALTLRRQQQARLRERQGALAVQYADMGEILSDLARTLDQDLISDPFRERKLRRYLKSQDVEAETTVFRDRRGRLHAEVRGGNLRALLRDRDRLAKFSAVLGVRLCEKRAEADAVPGGPPRIALMEAEPLAAAVGIAAVRRKGQSISGDRSTYFKNEDGNLYLILCDGMGTGPAAARESGQLSNVLEQFLQAGLDPAAAMKLTNGAFQVKNGEFTGCASVDLLCLNLFSGQTQLFKYGAAPTFFKRGRTIRRVKGESLAAGLKPDAPGGPDAAALRLEPGSFAVMISDGVSPEEDDKWLRALMANYTGTEAKELAREILEAAIARTGHEDDKTVLAVYLEERA